MSTDDSATEYDVKPAAPREPTLAPEVVGPYRPLYCLGRGGMGEVYLAEQRLPVERLVALKLMSGTLKPELLAYFEIERRALARMQHPSIAQLLDAGTTPEGRPYFAMEYVQGSPLTQFANHARLSLPARVSLFIAVCRAVQHAHEKGVVHRDLKPANILVTEVDGNPLPKLIDFGIASAVSTRARAAGTPDYMSPEQRLGEDQVDTRTDVYALGVVLVELLGGIPASTFAKRHTGSAQSFTSGAVFAELSPELRAEQAASLGVAVTRLQRLLNGELGALLARATQPVAARRYATAQALADDLQRWQKHQPLEAMPAQRGYLLRKFVARNRLGFSLGALGVLATLLAFVVVLWALSEARQQRDLAQRAELEAGRQARIAASVNRFLTEDLLGAANIEERADADRLTVRELVESTAKQVRDDQGLEPEAAADIRFSLGRTLTALGRYAAAREQFQRAAQLRRGSLGPEHAQTLAAELAAASVLIEQSQHTLAGQEIAAIVQRARAQRPVLQEIVERAALIEGRNVAFTGDYPRGVALTRSALASTRLSAAEQLEASTQLIWLLSRSGAHEEALRLQHAVVQQSLREVGPEAFATLTQQAALATVLHRMQRYAESRVARDAVLSVLRQRFPEHPSFGINLSHLSSTLIELKEYPAARAAASEAIAMLSQQFGESHRMLGNAHSHLGAALWGLGELPRAEAELRTAQRIYQKTLPAEHSLNQQNEARLQGVRKTLAAGHSG